MPVHPDKDIFGGVEKYRNHGLCVRWHYAGQSVPADELDGYLELKSQFEDSVAKLKTAGMQLSPQMRKAQDALATAEASL